jgi:O-acetyl-ADP-ribose deacetylase (regulator of RNase III)
MILTTVEGDILDQDVQVIVNAWNRNIIPWWLLLPQGVSGAIKRRGGRAPFRELIHVAGINMFWRSSEVAIRDCVRNAMGIVDARGWATVAFPVIGAGSGGFPHGRAREVMLEALAATESPARAVLVDYTGS